MAAYLLADHGLSVVIIEKARLPRYKTCGGGVVYRSFNTLPYDISDIIEKELYDIKFFLNGSSYEITKDVPPVSMVMRADLDHFMTQKALQKGAILMEECSFSGLTKSNNGISTIQTPKRAVKARVLIAADGVHSPVAKAAGFIDKRRLIPAIESEIWTRNNDDLMNTVRFDVGFIPKGYGWVFPKKDHLSVGVGYLHKSKIRLRDYYETYLQKTGIKDIIKEEKHGFLIPVKPRGQYFKENIFVTGDAAGLADPVVAEGISSALLSGKLVADAIIQARMNPMEAGKIYTTLLKNNILSGMSNARFLANLFYKHERIRNFIFKKNGQKLIDAFTDIFTGRRNYPVSGRDCFTSFLKAFIS